VQSKKEGDQNIDVNTLFPIWSMTKPITIVAMMKLHEQGKFDWNDPVFKYIPCFKNLTFLDGNEIKACHDQLRVIHLMTHRSGYRYYDSDPLPKGVPNYEAVHPNQSRYNDLETYVQAVAKQPLEFSPGTRYLYGINQAILGRLVEVLSGKDFETFLTDMIFTPLGMKDTSFTMDTKRRTRFQPLWINSSSLKGFTDLLDELTYSPDNKAHFGGEGLVSTMEDYARFCEMLVEGGVFRGKRIISEQSISTMTKKWSAAFPEEPNAEELLPGYVYGFSLFVLDDPSADNPNVSKGIYGWAGYHNTHFWVDPEKRMFGLFMSRAREFNWKIPLEFREAVYGKKP
jgi:CubicO group peptidase (beta-lactamase class C family)